MRKNCVVGQSGGPTAVINSSIAGVYYQAKREGYQKVYGMIHGIEGFLQGKVVDLDKYLADPMGIELLKRTPSAFLGSCRFKMPKIDKDPDTYQKVIDVMDQFDIETLFYAGGNDSMDTVKTLSDFAAAKGIKDKNFMGVPKTIDNDLPITDHCPGYPSAIKYVAASIKEIIRDNESFGVEKPTIVIVEIMGRHAGWLTAGAALAKGDDCSGCDAIYLPERVFDLDKFMDKVKYLAETKHSVVIAVSEGIMTADGKFVCEAGDAVLPVDAFGHKQLGGTAANLCRIIAKETGLKTRYIEFSTLQRAASHLASLTDINEAFAAGRCAAKAAAEGKTALMPVFKRLSSSPYLCDIGLHDIHDIANVEKSVPDEYITEDGAGITDAFIKYAKPLIMGELDPIFVNGLPRHIVMKELND